MVLGSPEASHDNHTDAAVLSHFLNPQWHGYETCITATSQAVKLTAWSITLSSATCHNQTKKRPHLKIGQNSKVIYWPSQALNFSEIVKLRLVATHLFLPQTLS